jgi:SHS family sialic acid transporter-like MFS transporter
MSSNAYQPPTIPSSVDSPSLSSSGRYLILICAFLGWMCAGFHLQTTSLAMQSAAIDLLGRAGSLDVARYQELNKRFSRTELSSTDLATDDEKQYQVWKQLVASWFAWYQCAFLFGAATGGLLFGRLGDRIGRSKAMAASILTYSLFAAASYFAQSPLQLLVLWFVACTGVGGMWPNGVALVSEAWSNLSRPMVAGLMGTSANVGIFLLATVAATVRVTPDEWRWVMLVAASPMVLGVFSLFLVPESPCWLAARDKEMESSGKSAAPSSWEIFRPPLLKITLVGILLATIPLIGGWGSANWIFPWAGEVGEAANPPNPFLKAHVGQARSLTGIVGSLLGGWVASLVGRRRSYFLISLIALAIAQYTFWFVIPTDRLFLFWVAALGFFSGIYFGWLPLFLPELFPTRSRSTGAGVSFNFGRILTAVTIFATGALMQLFAGDYARIGRVTSLVYALGMLAICFAPDTSEKQLED